MTIIRNNPTNNVLKELKQSHCFRTEKRRALTKPEEDLFLSYLQSTPRMNVWYPIFAVLIGTGLRKRSFYYGKRKTRTFGYSLRNYS